MFLGVLVFIVLADQITKYLAYVFLQPQNTIPVINRFFYLTYFENTGAVSGRLSDSMEFYSIIEVFIILTALYFLYKEPGRGVISKICISLITAGMIGNMADMVRLGFIIDFFDIETWPVFNLADISICAGILIMMLGILFKSLKNGY